MNEEPSVLDYLKSLLMPWKGERIIIPPAESEALSEAEPDENEPEVEAQPQEIPATVTQMQNVERVAPTVAAQPVAPMAGVISQAYRWPWFSFLAVFLALFAQLGFEPPDRSAFTGILLYALAGGALAGALLRHEWTIPELSADAAAPMTTRYRGLVLLLGGMFVVMAYFAFSDNRFTVPNLLLGLLALTYVIMAFYERTDQRSFFQTINDALAGIQNFFRSKPVQNWGMILLVIALAGLAIFYRYFQLSHVPGEMFSDHAEKLLDVSDVLMGKTSIFFPRNTGREAIQFYLTAAIISLFGTGISYISLKLGTATIGLLTLPYIYLLGKEVGGKWVGLFAVILAAIGYWPNVIARIGLRFPLYPAFAAPALYYLIRGLRRQRRNDFIWSGVALGFGLHGYTPIRILPIVLIVLIGLYLIHRQAIGKRRQVLIAFAILGLISFVIFLPLARYATESPMNMQYFDFRALSRLGTAERSYPAPPLQIFADNLFKAWTMPFWDDGETWVNSIPGRPALDVVTAALYFLGMLMVLIRYVRQRHWLDLFLLAMVPLLMLPSILSLAFPEENPSLPRGGAAYIPIFIMAAIGLEGALKAIKGAAASRLGLALAVVVGAGLLARSAVQNYNLVFNTFEEQYMLGTWNTSQIGAVVHEFATTIGTPDSAFVIPYPYWVDTRLVGMNAGYPLKDYAIQRDDLASTRSIAGPKLFIYKPEDAQTGDVLKSLYPNGYAQDVKGTYEGKDFVVFMVMP